MATPSFTRVDTSLLWTLFVWPLAVHISEVLLYLEYSVQVWKYTAVSVYLISVLGVRTAAALIWMQCRFRGPCNALNMHSTSVCYCMGYLCFVLEEVYKDTCYTWCWTWHQSFRLKFRDGISVKDVRYSKAQKMLKFTFNALIQQLMLQLLQKSVEWYLIIWFSYRIFGT